MRDRVWLDYREVTYMRLSNLLTDSIYILLAKARRDPAMFDRIVHEYFFLPLQPCKDLSHLLALRLSILILILPPVSNEDTTPQCMETGDMVFKELSINTTNYPFTTHTPTTTTSRPHRTPLPRLVQKSTKASHTLTITPHQRFFSKTPEKGA